MPKLRMTKPGVLTVICGLTLIVPALLGISTGWGMPTVEYPFPALIILPAFAFGPLAAAMPSFLFYWCNPNLFRGETLIPRRSYWAVAIAMVLNCVTFAADWEYDVQSKGAHLVYTVGAINAAWMLALILALVWNRRAAPSFLRTLFLHWFAFLWLAWYAFPYLGELP